MKYLYFLFAFLFYFSLQAQQYYYNGDKKVTVFESSNSFITYEKPSNSIKSAFNKVQDADAKGFTILDGYKNTASAKFLTSLGSGQTIPALQLQKTSDFKMYPTKTIRVKLKKGTTTDEILNLIDKNEILHTNLKYGILRLEIKDIHKVLDLANEIYESGLVEFSTPDFYIPIVRNQQGIQDPLFPQQFQMNNTGQVVDGITGVNDMDCNALEAWNLALGNNVIVAVIDDGLEAHEDLANRYDWWIHSGK